MEDETFTYSIHGVGCRVVAKSVIIDFDFGPGGRIDGFDAWRLSLFAQNSEFHDLSDLGKLEREIKELEKEATIVKPRLLPSRHLYYWNKI